jgi:hypothetical protein
VLLLGVLYLQDFEELGVKDRGAEIREIVEGVIRVRQTAPCFSALPHTQITLCPCC